MNRATMHEAELIIRFSTVIWSGQHPHDCPLCQNVECKSRKKDHHTQMSTQTFTKHLQLTELAKYV